MQCFNRWSHPLILFFQDGKRLNDSEEVEISENKLIIDSPTADAAGRYTCIAENKAGRSEKDIVVEVQVPPKMTKTHQVVEVVEGEPLALECPVEDTKGVVVEWHKHSRGPIPQNSRQLSGDKLKMFQAQAQLSDQDTYSCIARNEAGYDEAEFEVIVTYPPSISGEAFSTTEVVANTTLALKCQAQGSPHPGISWLLDGLPIDGMPGVRIVNSSNLYIDNIKPSQEGRYTCRAENKLGRAEQDTYVEISEPPKAVMASERMKVVYGRQATIRCEVFGDPEPKVTWLKNDEPFTSDLLQHSTKLSYLHLREAILQDGGKYTCIATNRAGESRTSTEVEILNDTEYVTHSDSYHMFSVAPRIEDDERIVSGKENNTLSVHCRVSGHPEPTVTWKKNGKDIGNEYETIHNNHILLVENASKNDQGKFTCTATNEAGTTTADFILDVLTKPVIDPSKTEYNVVEGDYGRIECIAEGHPKPTITWLRGGRPINMENIILSPRGDVLMLLDTKRYDGGSYTCVATNTYGKSELDFKVNIHTKPYIDEPIDQTPRYIVGETVELKCPVYAYPKPTVVWKRGDQIITPNVGRYTVEDDLLRIRSATEADGGSYTCYAENEAGNLTTKYSVDIIGKPVFERKKGDNIYHVVEDTEVTIECGVVSRPMPDISWFRGGSPMYIPPHYTISEDGTRVTIHKAQLSDGGKFTCRASNEAGSSDIDMIVRVLVPPRIDKSNIIGNPLAIVARNIYLECPVTGIPQPDVIWTKDGKDINTTDSRIILAQNNETFGIEKVKVSDQGRYTCTAINRGGQMSHDFNLDVLSPPAFDITGTTPTIKREGDTITLTCPIRVADDVADQVMDVSWTKDSVALDGIDTDNVHIADDGRKLTINKATLDNAGMYTCIALNRAGEATLEFKVEILCTNLATLKCRELENNYIARHMPHDVTKTRESQADATYREHMRKYEEYLKEYEEGLQRQRDESIRRQKEYWERRQRKQTVRAVITRPSTTTTTTPRPTTTTSVTTTTTTPRLPLPWVYNPQVGHPPGASGTMNVKATVQHPTRNFRLKRIRPVLRCFLYDPFRHVFLREKSAESLPPNRKGFLKYPLNNRRLKRL
ncbi:hypothetical protein CRE_16675 [Caenorhabditis remanei]|uniref:Ig-like domain-containing protein n=1 Tax=Caenorhabditis remanei TaxID=31234 RepID=E3MB16_CAERE|nr:hypothetical protein CRE_16675 [Caenorhabditis remanei]